MVHWQGPYQVVEVVNTTTLHIQNVGGGKIVPVSWRKCKRLGGPELTLTDAMRQSALHDLQRFLVEEILAWRTRAGQVELRVKWRGYDVADNTWEPLATLHADVPYLVGKYVSSVARAPLTRAHNKCLADEAGAEP